MSATASDPNSPPCEPLRLLRSVGTPVAPTSRATRRTEFPVGGNNGRDTSNGRLCARVGGGGERGALHRVGVSRRVGAAGRRAQVRGNAGTDRGARGAPDALRAERRPGGPQRP